MKGNPVLGIIIGLIIILCSIGIVIAFIFQRKQEKKRKKCEKIIKEKGDMPFAVKSGLSDEDILNIDDSVNVNKLMSELYDKYLTFQKLVNSKDTSFEGLLTDNLNKRYTSILSSDINTIIDRIDLVSYSITKFEKDYLEFRITINCVKYKVKNDEIIYGSNLEKIELISSLTYKKEKDNWLLDNINEIYEKKMSN